MKKLTSVVLSVLMVVSMLSCLFVGSASAEGTVNNPTPNSNTENINPFENAKFYDKADAELANVNEYVAINKTVNGEQALALKVGDEVTATPDYNKDCNVFAGWFKNGELFSREETVTFTVNDTDKYYPRFINRNVLTSSASFEDYAANTSLVVTDHAKYPEAGQWGVNFTNGYFRATKDETIYDKDHKSYQQQATNSPSTDTRTVIVDDTKSYKGSKSLKLANNYAALSTCLDVEKNTNYILTYYVTSDGTEIRHTGIATTLNIAQGVTPPTAIDGGSNAGNLVASLDNFPNCIAIAKQSSVAVNSAEWKKITLDFNSGEFEKLYFVVAPNAGATFWIDEVSLAKENVPDTADVQFIDANGNDVTEANAANAIVNATIEKDIFEGTNTFNIDYDSDCDAYTFKGWYYEDALITTDKTFILDGNKYPDATKVKAVVTSTNIIPEAASFEGYKDSTKLTYGVDDATEGVYPAPTTTKWGTSYEGTYFKDNYFQILTVKGSYTVPSYNAEEKDYSNSTTVSPHSGDSMLRINTHSRSAIRALTNLTPNTDYTLSFYAFGTSAADYISHVGISDRYNGYRTEMATPDTEGNVAVGRFEYAEGWQKVEVSFNSGNNDTLYLFIYQQASAYLSDKGGSFVDDLVCYEVEHNFGEYVSDGNATCTEDGTKTATCTISGCGATDTVTDEGSKLGHSFTNYVSDGNATCTEDGTKTAVCDREDCNVTNTIADEGSKLGHSFTKYVSDKNATCTADGTKTAVCDRDGCNVTNTVKDVGTKLAHKYTNSCDATCNVCGATRTVGAHKYSNNCDTTCNICGAVRKITHSYKTYTTKATLTKNGSIVKKCSVCGVTASTTVIYYPKTVKIAATTYTYNGKVITPAVTVKNSKGTALKKGTDYTVTYASGRKNVGKYKVTVTFKGNYSGTKTFYFTINPVKTTVRKLTAGKKSIKVNITKKSTQVTGYQIQYSTSKTFKSAKTKTISSYKTTSTTLTKLTSKKTYYVRVRTYKTVGKTKYYSAWSTYKYTKAK